MGSSEFVRRTQDALGLKGRSRDVAEIDGAFVLREGQEIYRPDFEAENRPIASKNRYFGNGFC